MIAAALSPFVKFTLPKSVFTAPLVTRPRSAPVYLAGNNGSAVVKSVMIWLYTSAAVNCFKFTSDGEATSVNCNGTLPKIVAKL